MGTPYKIRMWKRDHTYTDVISNDILFDDKITIVRGKICKQLGVSSVYMWVDKRFKDTTSFMRTFIDAMFQGKSHMVYSDVMMFVQKQFPGIELKTSTSHTSKSRLSPTDVYFELKDMVPNVIPQRLEFNLKLNTIYDHIYPINPIHATASDIPSSPLTMYDTSNNIIYDFSPVDEIINVISKDELHGDDALMSMYFPIRNNMSLKDAQSFSKDSVYIDILQNLIQVESSYVKKLFVVVHPIGMPREFKLRPIFDNFVLDTAVPLLKYRTQSNMFYKMDRDALNTVPQDVRDMWKIDAYNSKQDVLIFKVYYGDFFVSLFLFSNLSYHIKLTFRTTQNIQDYSYIQNTIVPFINHVIYRIQDTTHDIVVPLFSEHMIHQSSTIDFNMYSHMSFAQKLPPLDKIESKLLGIKTLFHKLYNVQHKLQNVVALRYKKCSAYMPAFDIITFLKTNINSVRRYELINMLVETFQISRRFAETLVNEYADTNRFFMARNFDGVTIKVIRKNDIEAEVVIRGTHMDIELGRHIMNVIYTCLSKNVKAVAAKRSMSRVVNDSLYVDDFFHQSQTMGQSNVFVSRTSLDTTPKASSSHEEDMSLIDDDKEDEEMFIMPRMSTKIHLAQDMPSSVKDFNRYTLKRLQDADPKLFAYAAKSKNYKSYAANCAANEKRQPIVVPKDKLESFDKDAYQNSVVIGENAYICPKVWCTASEIPLSAEKYAESGCPHPDDVALKLHDNNETKYVGFLEPSKHPEEACVPCCFLVDHRAKKDGALKQRYDNCTASSSKTDNMYIKGSNVAPLDANRYGKLPFILDEHLNSNGCTKSTACFVRKGIAHNGQYFLACLSHILENYDIPSTIIHNLQPHEFLACGLLKYFICESMFDTVSYVVFREWFLRADNYIDMYNLHDLQKHVQAAAAYEDLREPYVWEAEREFVIYIAMQNFFAFLNSSDEKDHTLFMDLLRLPWLNTHNINVVIVERIDDDIFIHKSLPRSTNVFVLKWKQFYEPIYMKHNENEQLAFATGEFPKLDEMVQLHDTDAEVVGASHQVIDMSYKVIGYIVDGDVFVPLQRVRGLDVYMPTMYSYDMKYDVAKTLKHLNSIATKDTFYKATRGNDGIVMGDGVTVVPFESTSRDLHIFAGIQLQNEAIGFLEQWNLQQSLFYGYMKSVTTEILHTPDMKREFEFLRSDMNFFAHDFKLKMMVRLCMRTNAVRGMNSLDVEKMADAMLVRDLSMLLMGKTYDNSRNVEILTQEQIDNGADF